MSNHAREQHAREHKISQIYLQKLEQFIAELVIEPDVLAYQRVKLIG